jgi:beta-galactosidase GanA
LCGLASVKSLLDTPIGVEVVEHWRGDQQLLFMLNHNDIAHHIEFDAHYVDLLSGEKFDRGATIAPWGVLILTDSR